MRYALTFSLLAAVLVWWAVQLGGWGLLLLWPAADLFVIAAGYATHWAGAFGKRPDGTIALHCRVFYLPFLLWQHALWFLACRCSHERAYDTVCDGLVIGRRLLAGEAPAAVVNWVDLTAEFAEPAVVRQNVNYIALPILDADVPTAAQLDAALARLQPGTTYVHCAQGHGRTAIFAVAWLAPQGKIKTAAEGLALLRQARPGVRLSASQGRFLQEWLCAPAVASENGTASAPQEQERLSTVCTVVSHGLLLLANLSLLRFFVPLSFDAYADMGVRLPFVTGLAIDLSRLVQRAGPVPILVVALLLAGDVSVDSSIYRHRGAVAEARWFASLCVLLAAMAGAIFLAVVLPWPHVDAD